MTQQRIVALVAVATIIGLNRYTAGVTTDDIAEAAVRLVALADSHRIHETGPRSDDITFYAKCACTKVLEGVGYDGAVAAHREHQADIVFTDVPDLAQKHHQHDASCSLPGATRCWPRPTIQITEETPS